MSRRRRGCWVILNKNGNPPVGLAESLSDDRKEAERTAKMWAEMTYEKNNPNKFLSVHRCMVELPEAHGDKP